MAVIWLPLDRNERESASGSRLVKNTENKACFGQKLKRKLAEILECMETDICTTEF